MRQTLEKACFYFKLSRVTKDNATFSSPIAVIQEYQERTFLALYEEGFYFHAQLSCDASCIGLDKQKISA